MPVSSHWYSVPYFSLFSYYNPMLTNIFISIFNTQGLEIVIESNKI